MTSVLCCAYLCVCVYACVPVQGFEPDTWSRLDQWCFLTKGVTVVAAVCKSEPDALRAALHQLKDLQASDDCGILYACYTHAHHLRRASLDVCVCLITCFAGAPRSGHI